MKLLITGASGFIGQALVQRLAEAGHQLTLLSHRRPLPPGHTPLRSLDGLSRSEVFDGVVNLAGAPIFDRRWSESRKQQLWDSRVDLTHRLVTVLAQLETPPAFLLSGSAIGVYGDQGETRLTEETPLRPAGFGQRLCAAWEAAAEGVDRLGTRRVTLRTGLVVGRNGGFLQPMRHSFSLGLGGTVGRGTQYMSWIHLEDTLRLLLFLIDQPDARGVINLTAPNPVTNAEFTDQLAAKLGRPARLPMPAAALRLIMGERAELLLESQRVVPERALKGGFQFQYETLDSALAEVLAAA